MYVAKVNEFLPEDYKPQNNFLEGRLYGQVLDSIVIGCVDIAVTHDKKMVLAKRTRHPQADWWIFGGRMKAGESMTIAAKRLMFIETGITIDENRLKPLTVIIAAWNKRAHPPEDNGTHTISIVVHFEITDAELEQIDLNDEYTEIILLGCDEVAGSLSYHPAVRECARLLSVNMSN